MDKQQNDSAPFWRVSKEGTLNVINTAVPLIAGAAFAIPGLPLWVAVLVFLVGMGSTQKRTSTFR